MNASRGEIKIREILEQANLRFTMEQSFEGLTSSNGRLLRFDFCVFDDDGNVDFLIEYQGKQHYEPSSKYGGKRGFYQQVYNDNKKRRFCALNNYKLIEIPYFDEYQIDYDYIMSRAGY